jgi:hypothetical protein
MPSTAIDLYRIGDTNGAAFSYVRAGVDVDVYKRGMDDWVKANSKGASTRSVTYQLKQPTDRWWKLPANTNYPAVLDVFNDHGNHWLWIPLQDMALADYIAALDTVGGKFV